MKTTAKITILLMMFVLVAGTIAFAQPGPGERGGWRRGPMNANASGMRGFGQGAPHRPGGRFGPGLGQGPGQQMPVLGILRRLDLTEEQKEQVKTILKDNRETSREAQKAVRNTMKAVHQAVMDEAGEEAIRDAAAQAGRAIGDQAVLRAQVAIDVKSVLTEEQLQKLESIKEKMQVLQQDMKELREEIGPRQQRGGRGFGPRDQGGRGRRGMWGRGLGQQQMQPRW